MSIETACFSAHGAAPAKLNLALEITGVTPDGFHGLRSIMISLELADRLSIEGRGPLSSSPNVRLRVSGGGEDVPVDGSNLVVRAIMAYISATGGRAPAELDVALTKRIPSQAGLGGGSADAGAALRMLAETATSRATSPLSRPALLEVAARLGSDVPFMVEGGAALAEGRGERLTPLRVPEAFWAVLVQPEERIPTAWCYRRWDELTGGRPSPAAQGRVDAVLHALQTGDLAGVAANLYNDLQDAVMERYPHLETILLTLREGGCEGALMTGSGSVFFGLARNRAAAREAAALIRGRGLGHTLITRTWREVR